MFKKPDGRRLVRFFHVVAEMLVAGAILTCECCFMNLKAPVFWDLIRPRWRAILFELKVSGAMAASDLSSKLGGSYMAARTSCEDLVKAGYLIRTRQAGKAFGRPEILFSLSEKATLLFPQCGPRFTLELLEQMKRMHGENAPERLIFQYFQYLKTRYLAAVQAKNSIVEKTTVLVDMREADGCIWTIEVSTQEFARVIEHHNPLQAVFKIYPRMIEVERRILGEIMGTQVERIKLPCVGFEPERMAFEFRP